VVLSEVVPMRVYVLGAGVSKTVGYPLARELFDNVSAFLVRGEADAALGPEWREVCEWLKDNKDPLLAEAYRTKDLEAVLTVLDLAWTLERDTCHSLAVRRGGSGRRPASIVALDKESMSYVFSTDPHRRAHRAILKGLEAYLRFKHDEDLSAFPGTGWQHLRRFADKLSVGDLIITFNYDATVERALLDRGMWNPVDGYGFRVNLWKSKTDPSPVESPPSGVTVLHLHGAGGWYAKMFGYLQMAEHDWRPPPPDYEEVARVARAEPVSLDDVFLKRLGIEAHDPWYYRSRDRNEYQVLLYPRFVKAFGWEGRSAVLVKVWRLAAEALREAEDIIIIGYSLPEADSAARTLLLTNCDPEKLTVVNKDPEAVRRLWRLFRPFTLQEKPKLFEQWLDEVADPD
jgi:hypothetical protein